MLSYQSTIGLEIHIQLKTKSKMFCGCPNGFGLESEPNVHICPVCTAQPGSLPVINEEAVKKVIKTGLALNCQIPDFSKFDRKNYFYPDLPKGYQISQYDAPLCKEGYLELSNLSLRGAERRSNLDEIATHPVDARNDSRVRIRIRRIHLEEDTGKLMHPAKTDYSLVDFNRAGVPLMELVTEPDIKSASQAKKFCQELQIILRYLDVSDADMEKGQMRCEVNISLGKGDNFGTKVEIKNLNSFRAVERGIEYEIKRQEKILKSGEKVVQETRGWNDEKQETFSQRVKEEAHDYRYFPEPDLPPLTQLSILSSQLAVDLPELPQRKRERFSQDYKLPLSDIEIFINNKELADYFEGVISDLDEWRESEKKDGKGGEVLTAGLKIDREKLVKLTANYLINELPRVVNELQVTSYKLQDKITQENFAEFVLLVSNDKISRPAAQTVLTEMLKTGVDPSHIIGEMDLSQISDKEKISEIVKKVIKCFPEAIEDFKEGKENALQFLIGQVMREVKGKANPKVVSEIIKKQI